MKVNKEWLQDPGSKTSPRGEATIWILKDGADKEEVHVRFSYLSEYERLEAEDEGTLFAQRKAPGLMADEKRLEMYRRCFVLARALRQADDVDKQVFLAEGRASAGEMALRKLPLQVARDIYDQWWTWMESEFPEKGLTEEEAEEATKQAEGE